MAPASDGAPEEGQEEQAPSSREKQEADLMSKKSKLDEERELHKKMRRSHTAEYARDKKEEEPAQDQG